MPSTKTKLRSFGALVTVKHQVRILLTPAHLAQKGIPPPSPLHLSQSLRHLLFTLQAHLRQKGLSLLQRLHRKLQASLLRQLQERQNLRRRGLASAPGAKAARTSS